MKPAIRALAEHGPDSDDAPHRWVDALDPDGPYGPAGLRHLEPPDEPQD